MTKRKKPVTSRTDSEKLEEVIHLLQMSIALDLYKAGLSKHQVAKALGIGNDAATKMLKDIPRT